MLPGTSGCFLIRSTSSTTLCRAIGDREPVDLLARGRAGAGADVAKAAFTELRRLQAPLEEVAHELVREEPHAAVGVVDDEPLLRPEELVRDDERADRVVACAAARVPDHVRVALAQPRERRGVETRIHACEDREAPCRGNRKLAPRAELGRVSIVGAEDFVAD